MSSITSEAPTSDAAERRDALAERLVEATVAALELFSVHLGWRLGLYRVLSESGPLTPAELAATAAIDDRYAREWLEQQAVAGFVEVDDVTAPPARRRYGLPAGHDEVLARAGNLAHVAPFAPMVVGIAAALPDVVDAYRTGSGVPYRRFGADFRDGQGAINRPTFTHELAGWLEAITAVHTRLRADPPARVADLGCGQGWSSLAIARAYPNVLVDGFDLDQASILDARQHAVGDFARAHITFAVRDAAEVAASGPYDVVCLFETLHDLARPVEVLGAARAALAPEGTVLVVDERVSDSFGALGDPVERMMYGWSVTHCLPASRAEQPSAALGTVLRADDVRSLARAAGFRVVEVPAVENDFFRLYLLRP